MDRTWRAVIWLLVALLMGCQAGAPLEEHAETAVLAAEGDPLRGAALFQQPVIGTQRAPGCITCHSLDPQTTLVGPPLAGIGQSLPDHDALYRAIAEPDASLAAGFAGGVMPANYAADLTPQEMADLVAYLATLE